MSDFFKKIRNVEIKDIFHVGLFLLAYLPSKYLKKKRPNIWLISEREFEARDNGYWFYLYLNNLNDELDIVYAINPNSVDYKKIDILGESISFGTLRHWIYYLAANKVLSSQKNGNPNAAVCYFLQVYNILPQKFYFLQHGITKDDSKWLYYENTKFKFFLCGAKPEYDFVYKKFGYPESNIKYLGFPRFDNLHKNVVKKDRILIMPTWREWIAEEKKRLQEIEGSSIFNETNYYKNWKKLLVNKKFNDYIIKNNLEVIFYPHHGMQKYIEEFHFENSSIIIASWKEYDVQELLMTSELMITDYSSVFFDFIYMKKPVLFYQFDYDTYRENQYQEGYFDYADNRFGNSITDVHYLVQKIIDSHKENFSVDESFLKEHEKYFPFYDTSNSERLYKEIRGVY